MQRYDSYKDSGIQWLGEIPSHWEVLPGRVLFQENKTRNDGGNRNILSLSYGKIIIKKDTNEGLVPEEYTSYQIIKPGYIIVRCTDLQNDKVSLRTAVSDLEGIITGAYLGLVPYKKANPRFFHYLLRTWDNCKEIYRYGSGLRQSLSWLDFKYLLLPVPSLEEQQAIASYLDTVTAKIDEAIAQQQKMIDLLNERKQIIINNAVTKGLNPNAKMKPSGIDWIGEIPEHWEVSKYKFHGFIKSGDSIRNEDVKDEGAYVVYGGNGPIGFCQKYNIVRDAIVIGRVGALCGNVRYIENPAYVSDNALIFNITSKINHAFLLWSMESADFNKLNSSNAQPLITGTKIKNVPFALPSISEQEKIVEYLKMNLSYIKETVTNISTQITLLQERKQIIINDVVTGKVKVI